MFSKEEAKYMFSLVVTGEKKQYYQSNYKRKGRDN